MPEQEIKEMVGAIVEALDAYGADAVGAMQDALAHMEGGEPTEPPPYGGVKEYEEAAKAGMQKHEASKKPPMGMVEILEIDIEPKKKGKKDDKEEDEE